MLEVNKNLKVLISSSLTERNADISLKALRDGAYDYIHKPSSLDNGANALEEYKKILKTKLDSSFIVKDITKHKTEIAATIFPNFPHHLNTKLILIGASTGGPKALLKILKIFKKLGVRTPILITQHMPPVFTLSFAKQIEKETGYTTFEAESGMLIKNETVYVAPGNYHMVPYKNNNMMIQTIQSERVNYCRPSVDVMFSEYADLFHERELVSIILTGMGSDGAKGAAKIINKNNVVIVQDEESSTVWGMPGAAVKKKACQAVVPLESIPNMVANLIKNKDITSYSKEKVMV